MPQFEENISRCSVMHGNYIVLLHRTACCQQRLQAQLPSACALLKHSSTHEGRAKAPGGCACNSFCKHSGTGKTYHAVGGSPGGSMAPGGMPCCCNICCLRSTHCVRLVCGYMSLSALHRVFLPQFCCQAPAVHASSSADLTLNKASAVCS